MTSATLMELTATALREKCRELGAGHATAATRWDALAWLADGPAGLAVALAPGGQTIQSQEEDLTVAEEEIVVVVGHRLPPTKDPGEGLWKGVGTAPAFLDTLEAVRIAVQAIELPEGATGGFWRYRGRTESELQGMPIPAFELRFACDVVVDAGTGCTASIRGDDDGRPPLP